MKQKGEEQNKNQINKLNKNKINHVYEYSKDWTAHDFYGKYHLNQIKNQIPIPGTQIKLEQEHKEKKLIDIKRFENERELKKIETQKLMDLKKQTSEFTTRVHVHTLIGEPSDQAEKILKENYDIATKEVIFPDSQLSIDRFMKNVFLGRAHYISYAVTTGYKSINWKSTKDELGYTALHLAIVKGHVEVVLELLKYNADSNISSGIGNYPLHDCWVFWKAPVKREVRLEQERKTCEMIRLLCGYGANPNCKTSYDGSTSLHIACRLGPIHAVVLLLGFKADYMIQNKKGQTCLDIAIEYNNIEIQRILEYWNGIKTQLVHVDFIVQWKIFLNDPEAVISSVNDQSVEKIMFELQMRENMRKQDVRLAGGLNNFPVDDEFLLQCKLERNFIEKLKNQNKYYKDDDTPTNINTQRDGSITTRSIISTITDASIPTIETNNAVNSGNVTQRTNTTYEPGSWQSLTGLGKKKVSNLSKKKRLPPVREYYLKILSANSPEIPKQFNPKLRQKNMIARLPSNIEVEVEDNDNGEDNDDNDNGEENENDDDDNENDKKDDSNNEENIETKKKQQEEQEQQEEQQQDMMTSLFAEEQKEVIQEKPKTSQLYQRRKMYANRINLDGKFECHTLRPCTSSILHISRRTEEAPLEKTVEEESLLRYLTTTSKQRKLIALNAIEMKSKEKEKYDLLNSIKPKRNVSNIGRYIGVDNYNMFVKPTQRQLLYDRVIDNNQKNSMSILSTEQNSITIKDTELKYNNEINFKTKGTKIDMNVDESRSLFVSKELLPPNKELKSLEELKERLQTEFSHINSSNDEINEILSQSSTKESHHASDIISISELNHSNGDYDNNLIDLLELEKRKRQEIHYGAGRLTSTHQIKKIVEEPWSKVKGKYKISINI